MVHHAISLFLSASDRRWVNQQIRSAPKGHACFLLLSVQPPSLSCALLSASRGRSAEVVELERGSVN